MSEIPTLFLIECYTTYSMDTAMNTLKGLGLSDKLSKIYLAALEHGESSVSFLAEKSGVKRTTIYEFIDELVDDGFLFKIQSGKKTLYGATSPRQMLKLKRRAIERLEEEINHLEARRYAAFDIPKVKFYYGSAGFKNIWEEILENTKKEYRIITNGSVFEKYVTSDYLFDEIIKKRIAKGVHSRQLIVNSDFAKRIMLRDVEFGPIRIRAFGTYTMKIGDPVKFIKEIVGTDGEFTTEKITEQIKNVAITRFTDAIAESKIPVLDMAANYNEVSKFCEDKIKPEIQEYGIDMTKFLISNISLPPNVEAALDKRSSMGIIGDMGKFTQYSAADAMTAAANNPNGGGAAAGMGMGMGFGMANMMMGNMNQAQQNQQGAPVPPPMPPSLSFHAIVNGQQAGPFDLNALKQMATQNQLTKETLVWRQGMAGWEQAGKVTELVSVFGVVPPPVPPVPPIPPQQ